MAKKKPGKKTPKTGPKRPAKKRGQTVKPPAAAGKRKATGKSKDKPNIARQRQAKVKRSPPAVMADDIPEQVQSEYRQLLAQGLADKQVAEQLALKWKKLLRTRSLQDEFWLALAGTQWQLGRLTPTIKRSALTIIDRVLRPTSASRRAAEDVAAAQRRKALSALRGILSSPQPPRREVRRSTAPSSDAEPWPVGEVFAYKLFSGRYVLFHVVACLGDKSAGFWPVFALLDWIGADPPKAAEVQKLMLKSDPHSADEASVWMVSVLRRHPSDLSQERIDWLHIQREPHARNIDRGFAITYWKDKLDEKLRFDFGWE